MTHPETGSKQPLAAAASKSGFQWNDPFLLADELTEEERIIRDSAHAFAQDCLMPGIVEANRHETFDREIFREMGNAGLLGPTIEGYGCAGVG